ncbi:protein FAR1-RELATED SEQUENCE 5-like [Rhizophagus irregularis DAOM 181602=DAOM 197198]|nr:protein FAR1-RELATED SEQUENCE 5-like [Rhizophagus irregularis DAOM 181602=DAOM 197198]
MISEVIPPVESSNHNNHDNNEDNESTTPFAENILGSNFKDCVGSLPLINTLIKLEVETSFYSMTIAVHYIEQFALQNNFAIFKHKSEKFLDGTCRKKVLKCDLGGRYTQKLLRPTSDKMTMKGSKKQGTFPEEIMDQIEFYVIHGRCDALMVRNLLQSKYPDCVFLTQDLGNAIQKIKQKNGISLGGAASLLLKLLDLQANNPARLAAQAFLQDERQESYEWLLRCCLEACEISPLTFVTDGDPAMIAAVSTVFPEAHHMQCLFHLYQNLPKNFRSCLGSSLYQEFLKDFRAVQRSYCEKVFEQKSQNLVEKYAAGERYISTVLLNQKHTWQQLTLRFLTTLNKIKNIEPSK